MMITLAENAADKITLLLIVKWSRRRVIAFVVRMVAFHLKWLMPRTAQ
jgi:hypothetical protein